MEELVISSPSPEPIRLPKATLRRKRVEVVVKKEGKAPTREPSVITIQDSSDSDDHILEETNTCDNRKVIGGRSNARLSKEQAPYTRKHKANFQDPSCAAKRAVALEDRTRQLPKRVQGSSQTRRARFRIASLFDTDSSGADEPQINNPKGHKSQMSAVFARAQETRTRTVADSSKVPRASDKPHLDARKSSPIKSEFVSSWTLQQCKFCALHLSLERSRHEPPKNLVSTRVICHTYNLIRIRNSPNAMNVGCYLCRLQHTNPYFIEMHIHRPRDVSEGASGESLPLGDSHGTDGKSPLCAKSHRPNVLYYRRAM